MMHDLWNSQPREAMRDFLKTQWQARVSQAGGPILPLNFRFEIYRDPLIGLNEVVRGLLEFFPHKKTIAIVQGTTPKVSSFLTGLSKDGIICKEIPLALAENKAAEAFALMDADTLMVLSGTADPLSARKFNLHEFQSLLLAKKIFSVELSPRLSAVSFHAEPPSPYRAQLVSMAAGLSVAVLGSRAKGPPLIMGAPYFGAQDQALLQHEFSQATDEDQKTIVAFESTLPSGISPFFKTGNVRLWDRAVISLAGVDGYAFCELLSENKNWNLDEKMGRDFDTASGCRWVEWNFGAWLTEQGIDAETQRGLIIFSLEFLKANPNLEKDLEAVYKELLQLQNT